MGPVQIVSTVLAGAVTIVMASHSQTGACAVSTVAHCASATATSRLTSCGPLPVSAGSTL